MLPEVFEIWTDMQFSPEIARWICEDLRMPARSSYGLLFNQLSDEKFFAAGRDAGFVVILTKDKDFYELLFQHGPPPYVIWVRAGNCSNKRMKEVLKKSLPQAIGQLQKSDVYLIEIFE
jgi:predicted nuclease of predicted toxin-antitoxin system